MELVFEQNEFELKLKCMSKTDNINLTNELMYSYTICIPLYTMLLIFRGCFSNGKYLSFIH